MGKFYIGQNVDDGRFAEVEDIKEHFSKISYNAVGTCRVAGIPIISNGKEGWVDNSESSTMVVASTGSGKTRDFVIPAAYSCALAGLSFVVNDPKAENYRHLYKILKKKGYKIILLNFRNPEKGDSLNLLQYPSELYKLGQKDRAIEMFKSFANVIVESAKSDKDPFWHNCASALLTAYFIILAEEYPVEQCTIDNAYQLHLQGTFTKSRMNTPLMEKYFDLVTNSLAWKSAYPSIYAPNETRSSIYSVLTNCLSAFVMNQGIIDMTSSSSFRIEDLVEQPTAIFFITRDESKVYAELVSAMIDQIYVKLIDIAESQYYGKLEKRIDFILDEFGNLPAIPEIDSKITAARARGIRWLLTCQSLQQLSIIYGKDIAPIIIGNCCNLIYMHSRDLELIKMISETTGSVIDEYTGEKRPLVSVGQMQHFDKATGECLMLLDREYPFIAHVPDLSAYDLEPIKELIYPEREDVHASEIDFAKTVKEKEAAKRREEERKREEERRREEERKRNEAAFWQDDDFITAELERINRMEERRRERDRFLRRAEMRAKAARELEELLGNLQNTNNDEENSDKAKADEDMSKMDDTINNNKTGKRDNKFDLLSAFEENPKDSDEDWE